MISHNLCFSTCLGDIRESSKNRLKRVGVAHTDIDFNFLSGSIQEYTEKMKKTIFIAPNNVAYVRDNVRRGIVPQILEEFLQTRIMMKQSAKLYKSDPHMQNILEGR